MQPLEGSTGDDLPNPSPGVVRVPQRSSGRGEHPGRLRIHGAPLQGRVSLHTHTCLVPQIIERTKAHHPYDVPSISTRRIDDGNPEYLAWIRDQTQDCRPGR
ncbi:divalent-cation tolerance protein CutA [Amycolatopsis rhizosphaerae]|uniref:Divalent-cation tolerance protein CutA n=1 Tax=Amycolatopsis rhizosphaerae TaxID=2053003 RepID=A0A558DGH9_9PSEU|nr:divalent-cation tolerance protein CutA [Amycolatopsis rhizosphaerae]